MNESEMMKAAQPAINEVKRDLGLVGEDITFGQYDDYETNGRNGGPACVQAGEKEPNTGKFKTFAVSFAKEHIKSLRQLYLIIAHELRHVWQYATGKMEEMQKNETGTAHDFVTETECEIDAETYAQQKFGKIKDIEFGM